MMLSTLRNDGKYDSEKERENWSKEKYLLSEVSDNRVEKVLTRRSIVLDKSVRCQSAQDTMERKVQLAEKSE